MTVVEAFIAGLRPNSRGCWVCGGAPKYGSFYWNRKEFKPSHLAWRLFTGEGVPPDRFVLHRCDNPPCCNPAHLFLGTAQDNVADMMAKNRHHPVARGIASRAMRDMRAAGYVPLRDVTKAPKGTVRGAIEAGVLRGVRFFGLWFVDEAALESWTPPTRGIPSNEDLVRRAERQQKMADEARVVFSHDFDPITLSLQREERFAEIASAKRGLLEG